MIGTGHPASARNRNGSLSLMFADLAVFLRQLVLNPRQTSALVPSSAALAKAMAEGLGPDTGRVVEFGPGTGKLTQAILEQGVTPENLTLIEMNPEFADRLHRRFPGVTIHVAGAQDVARYCEPGVDAVISGLPLLSMPPALRRAIVEGAFSVLRPGGTMWQFTYGQRAPLSDALLQDLQLTATPGRRIWGNLPPAQVYALRRYHA
jgi:phosphatidylethanolamine/phosphatidyl-N-methylethanolamine N-methyltransferase